MCSMYSKSISKKENSKFESNGTILPGLILVRLLVRALFYLYTPFTSAPPSSTYTPHSLLIHAIRK